jgi:phospholipid/cholesterol/gamma-HCH transport system permease protein
MPATVTGQSSFFELKTLSGNAAALLLTGRLDARAVAVVWPALAKRLEESPPSALEVDASAVEYCDGAGLALLQHLKMGGMAVRGELVTVRGLRPELLKLFEKVTPRRFLKPELAPAARSGIVEEVGKAGRAAAADVIAEIGFIGDVVVGLGENLRRRRAMRWPEVWRVFEGAGVNALPIISLISLLVGLTIAFEAAGPFKMFGAQIFVANMIGIIMARELSALMTAILLAGRSGSAFAAELGTMKVNEELNALETMGLNPLRFLVVQRVLAGVLLTPLLTIYSIFVGILGGVIVMGAMGFSLVTIYNQLTQAVHCSDLLIGVIKGIIFGVIVAGLGCLRGMQTQKGPSAVGDSTTRAVVSSILLVIIADALIAGVLYVLQV